VEKNSYYNKFKYSAINRNS